MPLRALEGASSWQPSPAYQFVLEGAVGSLLTLNATTTDIRLRLTAVDASFLVDAFFVDPWFEH